MASLQLAGLRKSYGAIPVIHGVDLEIQDGEFVCLVGPSGCGKSTLLRMIAGLEDITAGELRMDNVRVNEVSAAERGLAMVFQSYALYPHMSVWENMAFGLQNMRMSRAEIAARVENAARMLRIEPYLQRKPKALSGGQRQRVAIGRAIVRNPKIFLFDEPLSNLDAELRVVMRKELSALHAQIGGTMIYVTHDQVEAMTLASRIVVLRAGQVEQVGAPLDLYNNPANVFVAGFIGSPRMNLLPAKVHATGAARTELTLDDGSAIVLNMTATHLAPGSLVTLGVRPEDITAVAAGSGDIDAQLELAEHLGSGSFLYAAVQGLPQITLYEEGQHARPRGTRLSLKLNRANLHLFDESGKAVARQT